MRSLIMAALLGAFSKRLMPQGIELQGLFDDKEIVQL
jgi:hypothetical protein